MPPHTAEFAPATRVTSRNDGPVAGSRSPSADSTRAACATSTLASTCGRCETDAITTSWVSGSIADGHAPIRVISRCSRSYAVPRVAGVGVRYQVASANRSARACSTPAVSAPASGWPPMNRGSSTAPTTTRLTEPTSVTTHSGPAAASTSPTIDASTWTGAATNAKSASATAASTVSRASSTAPRAIAASRAPADGS